MKTQCPKCKNETNFHFLYNYEGSELTIDNTVLCNECGEFFEDMGALTSLDVMTGETTAEETDSNSVVSTLPRS